VLFYPGIDVEQEQTPMNREQAELTEKRLGSGKRSAGFPARRDGETNRNEPCRRPVVAELCPGKPALRGQLPSLFPSFPSCEIFRFSGLRQEQIGGHAETFCQRADVRQRQPPFPAQKGDEINAKTQRRKADEGGSILPAKL
jgi:hypothetical protein